ncbi:Kinesin motor domain containing protein [Novymonas esmeraldas]|uniref:Kinesin motor domain containing protein n=1 Tax=Novymonas esmeraldas TaxID=1808958 RepID=A0AAW0EYP1_9TRYP
MASISKANLAVVDEDARKCYNFILDTANCDVLTLNNLMQMVAAVSLEQQAHDHELIASGGASALRRSVAGVPRRQTRTVTPQFGHGATAAYEYLVLPLSGAPPPQRQGRRDSASANLVAVELGEFDIFNGRDPLNNGSVTVASLLLRSTAPLRIVRRRSVAWEGRRGDGTSQPLPPSSVVAVVPDITLSAPSQAAEVPPRSAASAAVALSGRSVATTLTSQVFHVESTDSNGGHDTRSSENEDSTIFFMNTAASDSPTESDTVSFATEHATESGARQPPTSATPRSEFSIEFCDSADHHTNQDAASHRSITTATAAQQRPAGAAVHRNVLATTTTIVSAQSRVVAAVAGSPTTRVGAPSTARERFNAHLDRAQRQREIMTARERPTAAVTTANGGTASAAVATLAAPPGSGAAPSHTKTPASSEQQQQQQQQQQSRRRTQQQQQQHPPAASSSADTAPRKTKKKKSTHAGGNEDANAAASGKGKKKKKKKQQQQHSDSVLLICPAAPTAALHPAATASWAQSPTDAPLSPPPSPQEMPLPDTAAAPTEREMELASLVQHLERSVQRLLAQSHTATSRITCLRGALEHTQQELRAVHESHCTALLQLNVCAAHMGRRSAPPQSQCDDGARSPSPVGAAPTSEFVSLASDAPRRSCTAQPLPCPAATEDAVHAAHHPAGEDIAVAAQESPTVDAAPPSPRPQPLAQQQSDAKDAHVGLAPDAVQESSPAAAVPLSLTSTAVADVCGLSCVGGDSTVTAPLPTDVPSLHDLTADEARALLKQMGYIHHNRLLRRENALLMRKLRSLDVAAATTWPPVLPQPARRSGAAPRGDGAVHGRATAHPPRRAQLTQRLHRLVRIRPIPPVAVGDAMVGVTADVLLQWDDEEARLQVWTPVAAAAAAADSDDGGCGALTQTVSMADVCVVGPPLPQSVATVAATAAAATASSGLALRLAAAAQQRALYDEHVAPLAARMVRGGESGTVLAYGASGSGKTYTLFGDCGSGRDGGVCVLPDAAGLVPRAIHAILEQLHETAVGEELLLRSLYASRHDTDLLAAVAAAGRRAGGGGQLHAAPVYDLRCTMVAVDGDRVFDLLAPRVKMPVYEELEVTTATSPSAGAPQRTGGEAGRRRGVTDTLPSTARTAHRRVAGHAYVSPECACTSTKEGNAELAGVAAITFNTLDAGLDLVRRGLENHERRLAAPHAVSGGSHVIYTLTLTQQVWGSQDAPAADAAMADRHDGSITSAAEMEEAEASAQHDYLRQRIVKSVTSRLVVADLAGLARLSRTGDAGDERPGAEAAVQESLAALSDVMAALHGGRGGGVSAPHVPFHAHILTHLLREALVTATRCVVLGCVALSEAPMRALLRRPLHITFDAHVEAAEAAVVTHDDRVARFWRTAIERLQSPPTQQQQQRRRTQPKQKSSCPAAASPRVRKSSGTASHARTTGVPSATAKPCIDRDGAQRGSQELAAPVSNGGSRRASAASPRVLSARRGSLDSACLAAVHATVAAEGDAMLGEEEVEEGHSSEHQHAADGVDLVGDAAATTSVMWVTPRETLSTLIFLSRV